MTTDRTNEAWSHQQAELATLRAENARLLAQVEDYKNRMVEILRLSAMLEYKLKHL